MQITGYEDDCPKCNGRWQSTPIPEDHQELYGGRKHLSEVIGISDGNGVYAYECPHCHYVFDRDPSVFHDGYRFFPVQVVKPNQ